MEIQQLKECLRISKVSEIYGIGITNRETNQKCPFCGGNNSLKVYNDVWFKCFKCGSRGDIINLLQVAGKANSFREAVLQLSNLVDTTKETREYRIRLTGMEATYKSYKTHRKRKEGAEYLESRGWKKAISRGDYGYSDAPDLLRSKGHSKEELENLGLMLTKDRELYDSHVVFPVRTPNGKLVHVQGRNTDPAATLRWLADKGQPPINNYLYNIENLNDKTDYVVIVEGISDALSLLELGEPTVGTFGINFSLLRHIPSFKNLTHILAIFDRDKYSIGTPLEGRYKSWTQVVPELCKLSIELKIPIYTWMVPDISGIKDLNDLLIEIEYCEKEYKSLLRKTAMPLERMTLEVLKATEDKELYWLLWELHRELKNTKEEGLLEEHVNKQYGSLKEHFKWIVSAKR